jgi:hypothetical protein
MDVYCSGGGESGETKEDKENIKKERCVWVAMDLHGRSFKVAEIS